MMLFYVCARGSDDIDPGDDGGKLISAPDANTAASMWRDDTGRGDPMVFRVPPVSPTPMVHEWHASWALRGVQCLIQ